MSVATVFCETGFPVNHGSEHPVPPFGKIVIECHDLLPHGHPVATFPAAGRLGQDVSAGPELNHIWPVIVHIAAGGRTR